ncbi:MAG: MFS transporter [Cyclobacteriaceae bacterium]
MKSRTLILIILSQFMCTSLWFAGNAVMPDLIINHGLEVGDLGLVTSSVQLGFIVGTLFYSFFTIADRYSPSRVFLVSSLLGATFNVLIVVEGLELSGILSLRFLTGFFLAGIYPVGMKIASDYYEKGLGKAISLLVAALVVGTAFPHLVSSMGSDIDLKSVLYVTSLLAVFGGIIIWLFVPDGPYQKRGQPTKFSILFQVFRNKKFKAASFGYFGHMWELYAFWAFVPVILTSYNLSFNTALNVPFYSFLVIGSGALACTLGGFLSGRFGEKKIATWALGLSGCCCLISPVLLQSAPVIIVAFLIFWGWVVIVDSPLLSALVAKHADSEIKGSALTISTSIGFAISILSIQLVNKLFTLISFEYVFLVLTIGPVFGLIFLLKK